MNIQEAIQSGKPFRRRGWVDDDVYVVYKQHDIALTLEADRSTSIEMDVQDILAEDWYVREDKSVDREIGKQAHGTFLAYTRSNLSH